MVKNVIECDVDGVLLDIYSPVEQELMNRGMNFKFDHDVHTWDMKETGELRPELLRLLTSPEMRVKACWYSWAGDLAQSLYYLAQNKGWKLVFNSHEVSPDTAGIKSKLLKEFKDCYNLKDAEIIVQCGKSKEMQSNAVICVEDCLPNIIRSQAPIKFLIAHTHNSPKTNAIPSNIIRVTPYQVMQMGCGSNC